MRSQSSSGSDRRLIVQLLCESNYSGYSTVADAVRCYCIKISTDLLQDNCGDSCEVCGYRDLSRGHIVTVFKWNQCVREFNCVSVKLNEIIQYLEGRFCIIFV